jgi:hypothetical protein
MEDTIDLTRDRELGAKQSEQTHHHVPFGSTSLESVPELGPLLVRLVLKRRDAIDRRQSVRLTRLLVLCDRSPGRGLLGKAITALVLVHVRESEHDRCEGRKDHTDDDGDPGGSVLDLCFLCEHQVGSCDVAHVVADEDGTAGDGLLGRSGGVGRGEREEEDVRSSEGLERSARFGQASRLGELTATR